MALSITHAAVVVTADDGTSEVGSNEWNAAHTLTGAVSVAQGGVGLTSYAVGDILYASGASALSALADVATGNALISGGVTTAPSWGKIGLTTHVSGTLPVANGGTGITSLGAGVATFLGTPSSANLASAVTDETGTGALVFASTPTLVTPVLGAATFTSLTGSGATVTTSTPILDLSQTWNAGAVTFTALKLNVTNTASAAASLLLDLQVGSASKASVDVTGHFVSAAGYSSVSPAFGVGGVGFSVSSPNIYFVASGQAKAVLDTTFGIGMASNLGLGICSGAADGSSADVSLFRAASALFEVTNGAAAGVAYIRLNGVAVASLPAASATYKGARGTVTDSNTALTAGIGATVAASTSTSTSSVVPVFCDGAAWRIG